MTVITLLCLGIALLYMYVLLSVDLYPKFVVHV